MTSRARRRRSQVALAGLVLSLGALIALPAAWFATRPDVSAGELPQLEEEAPRTSPAALSLVTGSTPREAFDRQSPRLQSASRSAAGATAPVDASSIRLLPALPRSGVKSETSQASPIEAIPVSSALVDDVLVGEGRVPVSLSIPSIKARSSVEAAGVDPRTRELAVPESAERVVWYRHGASPGASGSAVLAAHVDYNGVAGAFYRLRELEPGDGIAVGFDDGSRQRFEVVARRRYKRDELPSERIFATDGAPVLTLITCGGRFDESERRYAANVVVFAVPVEAA